MVDPTAELGVSVVSEQSVADGDAAGGLCIPPSRQAIRRAALAFAAALGVTGATAFGHYYLATGRYLETSTAVPLYTLRDDPLFRSANIPFTEGTRQEETQRLLGQVERLSRTRNFNELRTFIENLYQKTLGRNVR